MKNAARLLILCVATMSATACEEDASPTTDKQTARAGWVSTQAALGEAGVDFTAMATVNEDGAMGTVTGTVECPEGGSMDVEVVGAVDDSMVSASVEIAFIACEVDGVVTDGSLDYSGLVTETEVSASFNGDLTWSGSVTGECAIDLEARVTTDGVTATGSSINGGLCGWGFSEVFDG